MPANVYQLAISGRDDDFPHLHVVVIDIDVNQRLCIPAYDADGKRVNQLTDALHRIGIYEGVGWIEIDNSAEIQFVGKWTGKKAKWVSHKLIRVEQHILRKLIGQMSDRSLARVVECLLKLQAEKPASTLTEDELKKVKKLASTLNVKVPKRV